MKTLSQHLKALNFGKFVNDKNEYCKVSTWYDKSTFKMQIVFQNEMEPATENAILTTSIKKVEKVLNERNFRNVTN